MTAEHQKAPKAISETPLESDDQSREAGTSEPPPKREKEHGGQTGPEPTRYGDWEKNGRCTDF